jgi:WD40 repeat protein
MNRLLPRTPRGTWLLAEAAWLVGCAILWTNAHEPPCGRWPAPGQRQAIGIVPGRRVLVTTSWSWTDDRQMRFKYHGPIGLWDADTGRAMAWLDKDERVDRTDIQLSADGRWLAARHGRGEEECRWSIYEIVSGGPARRPNSTSPRRGGRFSTDSRRFAYTDREAEEDWIRVWDVDAGREECRLPFGPSHAPIDRVMAFSPGDRTLATGEPARDVPAPVDAVIRLWDLGTGRPVWAWSGPPGWNCLRVQFSPDGRYLAAVFKDKASGPPHERVYCLDLAGQEVHRADAGEVSFPPGEDWFALYDLPAPPDLRRRGFDGNDGTAVAVFRPGERPIGADSLTLGVARPVPHPVRDWVTAQGLRWPFDTEEGAYLRFADVRTMRPQGALPRAIMFGSPGSGMSEVFSGDGRVFAVSDERGVTIWDVPPRKSLPWFLAAATALAVATAAWARRRSRRFSVTACPIHR